MLRQGDVLLIETEDVPVGAHEVPPEGGRVVLARGEATGHHHSIRAGTGATLWDLNGSRLLTVVSEAALTHQEHATVEVPPGTYRVVRQREYAGDGEVRRVID